MNPIYNMFALYFKYHALEFDPWYFIQILKFPSIIWVLNILCFTIIGDDSTSKTSLSSNSLHNKYL